MKFEYENERDLYIAVLNMVSAISSQAQVESKLTPAEIEILAEFLLIPKDFKYYYFSYPAKKYIMNVCASKGKKITRSRLNSLIYSLIEKKYLVRDTDSVIFFSNFVENLQKTLRTKGEVSFSLNFTLKDEHRSRPTNSKSS